ncbi:hypothetical protein DSECCO2_472570 [anaerobic digester metagenome]
MVFGRMCRHMMRPDGRPMTRAASTYSFFFSARTEARTVRAYCGHSAMPMTSTRKGTAMLSKAATPKMAWKMAERKMATMRVEKLSCTSAMRMRKLSTLPPLYPAISPRTMPMAACRKVAPMPMTSEMRMP